ncbi:MAG: hypothetical protein HAW59_01930 [Betaproteobacteria bacterium]|nr:hypothetical protein [Betaproteobacteria bacterium]
MKHREETANTIVAQILGRLLGMEVKPEIKERADRRLLDIYIPKHNAVLEAKYGDFGAAVKAAQDRWKNMNPAPSIVGALSYDLLFAENIEKAIREDAPITYALSGNRLDDLHARKRTGDVFDLAQALRRPAAILRPHEDEIEYAINRIRGALSVFCGYIQGDDGTLDSMARILQANFDGGKKKEIYEQAARVGGLILFGAMLFQIALAKKNGKVKRPEKIEDLPDEWRFILEKINYAAIFGVAERLLRQCEIDRRALDVLLDTAKQTAHTAAADGIDLMGRIYHTLLADAKPLGAFYTSIPAATMMAGLALAPEDWGKDENWSEVDFIKRFRIADPACGSGTLLAAACWQMRDNFSRADAKINGIVIGGKKAKIKPMDEVQKALLEESVWGYDILETAGHLTATTLGLIAPDVDFRKTHIYRTIIGETTGDTAAGSLELLESNLPIFKRDEQVETLQTPEPLPELDLCIMNPPFVRGTKGSLTFGFLNPKERALARERIKTLSEKHGFVHDGQGPAFIALACHKRTKSHFIRPGGRLALILPATFAVGMGNAWKTSRACIEKDFDLEMLIVSRESKRPNFSDSTNLQECIVVARKRKPRAVKKKKAMFVVLRRNPQTVDRALAATNAIVRANKSGEQFGVINGDSLLGGNTGEYMFLPYLGKSAWRGISFANMRLSLVAENLMLNGNLKPFARKSKIPMRPLGELAFIGSNRLHKYLGDPDHAKRRAVLSKTTTPYPGYFPGEYKRKTGISQKDLRHMAEEPQCHWLPLPDREEWADNYYADAGNIVLAESFGFHSMRRLAALISRPVQASHYWPLKLRKKGVQKRKALTLWLNSTPALLLTAHFAQTTKDTKVNLSQAAAEEMPVLDLEKLSAANLRKLAALFDKIAKGGGLLPIPQMENDDVRKEIDAAFSQICGFGDLSPLRAALANEPIITNKPAGTQAD